jgi:two-component system phosphate regulon sensor histidine kinase PhoR
VPRRLFARVFLHSALVLAAVLVAGGVALDRFLGQSEVTRLGDQVERFALLLREDVPRCAGQAALQDAVRRMGEVTHVRFTVVDRRGTVLADSDRDPALMENHSNHPEVAQALAGRTGRSLRRSVTLGIEMLYVAVPGNPVVRAAVPVSEVRSVLAQVRRGVLLAAFPATAVALALAPVLARSLTRRVEAMTRFASGIARGEYDRELRVGGDDELADMERSLLALRDEIRHRVDALRREKQALAALVEGLPHAVLVFDAEKRLALANAPARALFRLAGDRAVGLPVGEVVRDPRILETLDTVRSGAPPPGPFRLTWLDPPGDFEVSLWHLPGGSAGTDLLVILRDVTRETHLERVRTDFITNLSHELRTPLTAIRGSAETLLDSALGDPTASKRFLDTIRRNALRLEALLGDVSDLARAESGAEPFDLQPFDGREVAQSVVDLFAGEAHKAGVSLGAVLPDTPLPIASDQGKVESILINLVQNGVRYTPAGGRVTVSAEEGKGGLAYRVEDTGGGIPPRDLSRVTERFYRVDPGRSRAMGGTGLGLSIVKHLVELLGGSLEIESEHGRGTTVRVFIPDKGRGGTSDG